MSRDEFAKKYKVKTNFLEYNGIIRAIQVHFHLNRFTDVCKVAAPFQPSNMELLLKQRKGCKVFYDILITSKKGKTTRNKWQEEFVIQNEEWKEFCALNLFFLTDTKLRWFQYRINQSIIATNTLLLKMNIRFDDSCTFCNTNAETIRHLFVDCDISTNFWVLFKNWVEAKMNRNLIMTPKLILFGSKQDSTLTLLLTIAKFHLYRARVMEKRPNFNSLKREIKSYYNVLKYQAICNLQLQHFPKKWLLWHPLLSG